MPSSWVEQELASLDLNDERRERRTKLMVQRMIDKPGGSIPQASASLAEAKAAYRLLSNPDVDPQAIRDAACDACCKRAQAEKIVFVLQDTTSFDFTGHEAVEGLGPLGGGDGSAGHGMLVHSALAVDDDGVPLGLVWQKVWTRDPDAVGSRHDRKQRPIADKESFRWIEALRQTHERMDPSTLTVTIADREADIFELFAQPRPDNSQLLIRACHERRIDGAEYLLEAIQDVDEVGEFTVNLRRSPSRSPRSATLSVRFRQVTIHPPTHGVRDPALDPVTLTAVLAQELAAPEGEAPIRWLLLTDCPIASFEDARECVRRYSLRWLIERYHFVLKSGCRIEDSQLRTFAALEVLLALYCIVALRLLWMTYAARSDGDAPCTVAFTDTEWQTLWRYYRPGQPFPDHPPPLREAVQWTAKLGGYLARKGDADPGVKVLWRGLMRLQDFVIGAGLPLPQDVGNA